MADPAPGISYFSLSTEELAFIYYLSNFSAKGKELLTSTHGELAEDELKIYLTAARNSLIAKDHCVQLENGQLWIPEDLERAAFVLINCDRVLNLYRVLNKEVWTWDVFLNGQRDFCYHFDEYGAVHRLFYGPREMLVEAVEDFFKSPALKLKKTDLPNLGPGLPASLILTALEIPEELSGEDLLEAGWPQEWIDNFQKDLQDPVDRGVLGLGPVVEDPTSENGFPEQLLIYLQGSDRLWLFENKPSTRNLKKPLLATREQLQERIRSLIS